MADDLVGLDGVLTSFANREMILGVVVEIIVGTVMLRHRQCGYIYTVVIVLDLPAMVTMRGRGSCSDGADNRTICFWKPLNPSPEGWSPRCPSFLCDQSWGLPPHCPHEAKTGPTRSHPIKKTTSLVIPATTTFGWNEALRLHWGDGNFRSIMGENVGLIPHQNAYWDGDMNSTGMRERLPILKKP
jgi:hypothetical protein